jgi:hypothetical protein
MIVSDVEAGTFGSMDFPIDIVIVIEEPGEMSIIDLEFVDALLVLRQLLRQFMQHV